MQDTCVLPVAWPYGTGRQQLLLLSLQQLWFALFPEIRHTAFVYAWSIQHAVYTWSSLFSIEQANLQTANRSASNVCSV